MRKLFSPLIAILMAILFCPYKVNSTTTTVKEEIPDIVLGAEMPEDHEVVEEHCMQCHTIKVDAASAATKLYLARKGGKLEKDEIWKEIVEFFSENRQSCVLATSINNEPYVTTVDFALDPVNKVMYALSEKGTTKLGQMKINPKVALEYHKQKEWEVKVFRCLQMKGEARVFSADDPQFDEGLRVFKPGVDPERIKLGMDMTCFTPKEILFYDDLRKKRELNKFQLWER